MKLKTKFQDEDFELGEVVNANIFYAGSDRVKLVATAANGGEHTFYYNSLAHLNEDWEDAPEEPGRILNIYTDEKDMGRITIEYNTEKEAEEAVKKLEAWRRLKDKGFEFTGLTRFYTGRGSYAVNYSGTPVTISFNKSMDVLGQDWIKDNKKDLNLLFGGEE